MRRARPGRTRPGHRHRRRSLVRATLGRPLPIEQLELEVPGGIGIAVGPDHGQDSELLLQRADVAMYQAKKDHSGIEVSAPSATSTAPAGWPWSAPCEPPSSSES